MFWRKNDREEVKNAKPQSEQPAEGKGEQSGQPASKSGKKVSRSTEGKGKAAGQPAVKKGKTQAAQSGKQPAARSKTVQDKSDRVLAKLMEIEKEARLEQARDSVDGLEDEKIAEHIELLLKIMKSNE